jgi:hypothetical protein
LSIKYNYSIGFFAEKRLCYGTVAYFSVDLADIYHKNIKKKNKNLALAL